MSNINGKTDFHPRQSNNYEYNFSFMLPNLTNFKEILSPLYDGAEARNLYYMVLTELLDCDMTTLLLHGDRLMTAEKVERFDEITQKLREGQPVQHILGYAIFHGNRFFVNSNVLVPRPETEELVDWILQDETRPTTLLDIGTGSGCIAISLKKELKETTVFAMDVSEKAIETAKKNAQENHTEIIFIHDDILNPNFFDDNWNVSLIVSNPPYIRTEEKKSMHKNVLEHDPHLALFVPDEDPLMFYREIARFGQKHLEKGGCIYFEINEALAEETCHELEKFGYQNIVVKKDGNGKNRMIKCQK